MIKQLVDLAKIDKKTAHIIYDASLHDFYGAITRNKIGCGHTNSYYSGKYGYDRRLSETFANMVEIYGRKDKKIWNYIKKK